MLTKDYSEDLPNYKDERQIESLKTCFGKV